MKVAALYLPAIYVNEPDKNRESLEKAVRDCYDAHPGIDLAVAPELVNTGFHMIECEYWKQYGSHEGSTELRASSEGAAFVDNAVSKILPNFLERIPDGKTTRLLESLAQEYNTHFVCGIGEVDEAGFRYNSAVFVGPSGYQGSHRQQEKSGSFVPWTNGYGAKDQRSVFLMNTKNVPVGVVICAEITFPEIVGNIVPLVSLMGVPANWYEDPAYPFDEQLFAFDADYRIPLIMGNRGNELFGSEPHRNPYNNNEETAGSCAIIAIPGKKIIMQKKTIVETIVV